MAEKVTLVPVDPLHPVSGLLFPLVARRVMDFVVDNVPEAESSDKFTRSLLARMVYGDPDYVALALATPNGRIVGHVLAMIERDGSKQWVYVFQAKADESVGDAMKDALRWVDEWGRSRGATSMRMATSRNPKAWERAYGFEVFRTLMWRDIPQGA
jgi:hypothetical protein